MATSQAKRQQYTTTIHAVEEEKEIVARFHRNGVMYMAQKAKKKSKLRHAEYYDMQKTFDSLYADSKSGEVFGHLMDIISAPNNIKLAFRNIKGEAGALYRAGSGDSEQEQGTQIFAYRKEGDALLSHSEAA